MSDKLDALIDVLSIMQEPKSEDGWFTAREVADRVGLTQDQASSFCERAWRDGRVERVLWQRRGYFRRVVKPVV